MTKFPAILIGGPPHSGKSVFVYSLTHVLRQQQVSHYVLRACPDGEGDWSNKADQALVRTIRVKGRFNESYTKRVAHYLQKRHLPLLVDVGGRPTTEQQQVFGYCTHAILLIGGSETNTYQRDLLAWRRMMHEQGVTVLAELRSALPGTSQLDNTLSVITGTIANLERGHTLIDDPVLQACVTKVNTLFQDDEAALAKYHLAQSPVELTLDLPVLARTLGAENGQWQPEMLPALVDYLPTQKPLGLYGRSPNWVNATLAMATYPATIWLFDVRLGWVQPPLLPDDNGQSGQMGWDTVVEEHGAFWLLTMKTHGQYLDYDEPEALPLPALAADGKGLVLSGQIPHWLLTAVTRQLAPNHPWTAVFQPQSGGAVVVYSQQSSITIGEILSLPYNKPT